MGAAGWPRFFWLELPVVDGGGGAVGELEVGLGEEEVAFDHVEGGVAEDGLEGVDVAAVAQVFDGECVAKAVGMDAVDVGTLSDAVEVGAEVAAIEAVAGGCGEDGGCFVVECVALGEVVVEGEAGAAAEADDTLFALAGGHPAFACDAGGALFEVYVADAEVGEFAGADAGVGEGDDDGSVTELLEVGQLCLGLGGVVPGAGVGGGAEEAGDLVFGEGVDDGGFWFGDVDGFGEVVGGVAFEDSRDGLISHLASSAQLSNAPSSSVQFIVYPSSKSVLHSRHFTLSCGP